MTEFFSLCSSFIITVVEKLWILIKQITTRKTPLTFDGTTAGIH